MTNALILGGTGWLSGRLARRLRDDGVAVTCLARGDRPAPAGTALVRGDRDDPGAYAELAAHEWDHVIDISSRADHVVGAVSALGDRAARWTYVSSMSAYSDDVTPGIDETAPLHIAAEPGDDYEYGPQKVAAENAVRTLGDRALIVRPGLIVGTGDPSDRFGYWAAAFDRAGAGDVLLPPTDGRTVQVIDVADVAAFIASAAATGAINAIGAQHPLDEVLAQFRTATGHRGSAVPAEEAWLVERGVAYWAGERSLPLWLPAGMTGFMARSNAAYLANGGSLRRLEDTVAEVVQDERERGVERERRAGLTRSQERELLAELRRGRFTG